MDKLSKICINFEHFFIIDFSQPRTQKPDIVVKEDDEAGPSCLEVAEAETAAAKAETKAAEAALQLTLALLESAQSDLAAAKAKITVPSTSKSS